MTRIIVAGGRDFNDYDYLKRCLDWLLENLDDIEGEAEIVSGHAKGADSLGEQYAKERGLRCSVFKPDWKKYGKAAGVIRNQQMLDYASAETPYVAVFWDGKSRGTADMIQRTKKSGVNLEVFRYGQSA